MRKVSLESKKSVNENKLFKLVRRNIIKANIDFDLIKSDDLVMACVSGGKDSYAMLDALVSLRDYGELPFRLQALHIDQNEPKFKQEIFLSFMENYCGENDIEFKVVKQDIYNQVRERLSAEDTKCSLCSRLRRGVIYRVARELGVDKIALGHHADDAVNTMFMNMFFNGVLKSMPAKLISDDKQNIVIRPMILCREGELASYSRYKGFPVLDCGSCSDQKDLQRAKMKDMLKSWEQEYPTRVDSIVRAMQNVKISHLMDNSIYSFEF